MAADEIMQAFQQFQAGLNQLQASRVLTQANEAVTQIRNSELDATEKNNQLRVLGQQMAFGLAGQGVSPAQIQTLADTFMPAKPTPIQSIDQGLLSDDEAVRGRANQAMQDKAKIEAEEYARKQDDLYKRQAIGLQHSENMLDKRTAEKNRIRAQEREIPGVGYTFDASTARRLRKELPDFDLGMKGIEELRQFSQLESLNPVQKARAASIAGTLKGKLRLALIGPGAMSDQEQAILSAIVANPTDFFKFPGTAKASLEELSKAALRAKKTTLEYSIDYDEPYQPSQNDLQKGPASDPSMAPAPSGSRNKFFKPIGK